MIDVRREDQDDADPGLEPERGYAHQNEPLLDHGYHDDSQSGTYDAAPAAGEERSSDDHREHRLELELEPRKASTELRRLIWMMPADAASIEAQAKHMILTRSTGTPISWPRRVLRRMRRPSSRTWST